MDPSLQPMNDPRRVSKKRNRPPVSCGHCRIRKLKCNRAKPCESCVKAGDTATCSYNSNRPNIPRDGQFPLDQPPRDELLNRIDRLEQLVFSAMSNQPQPAQPAVEISHFNANLSGSDSTIQEGANEAHRSGSDPEIDELSTAFGVMKVDPGKTVYLGGAHWVSIMSEIKEFRNYLHYNHEDMEHDALKNRASTSGPGRSSSLLLGTAPPKTREELLSYMPPRKIADQLLTRCFDHYFCILPMIHESTFRKQYDEHWNDPTRTKIIWLAVLFGMFRLAALSYEGTEDEISASDLGVSDEYKVRAIDCLVAGDYTNPEDHTIEALLLYVQAEWMDSEDATIDLSVVIAMVVRLAMRMGIHRDSKAHLELTTFQGEMRRRLWAQLRVMDTLYSFQISLPASVRPDECDCELPRNIWNKDFDEGAVALPPPRPLTENTEVSYIIVKTRLLLVFGRILALTESSDIITTEMVIKYEQELYEIQQDMPPQFQVPSLGELKTTSLSLKKIQINLDRVYQAARCILYRKFLGPDSTHVRYRGSCIDAAMIILNHQATLFLECDSLYPENVKQRHRLVFTTHDFFIACMAIALDLHYRFESKSTIPSAKDIALWGYDRSYEMITALETSTEFWRLSREHSVEAAKAYGMFSFVLQKAKKAQRMTAENFGGNPDILDIGINYGTVPLDAPVEMKEAGWPPDFDWELWNSWKGGSEGFESLMQ